MSKEKFIKRAAAKFRRENPGKYNLYSLLISGMSRFIQNSGAPEVTVGYNGKYYQYANN